MRTADDIVERVREATNIIDVVSQYVQLRKRGRNFLGLCPFHNEKTPSFNVLEDKGIFKCFGCGAAGDVYTFLMRMEGLTFPETIEKLAAAANIPYERHSTEARTKESQELENLYVACKEFAIYCYKALRSSAGVDAKKFLASRGFNEDILHRFGVGYAPEGGFLNFLRSSNMNLVSYEKAGIISKAEGGRYYERFRNRVIFPVYNPTGKLIAFGGRVLPGTDKETAKYINSPETPIYHKSKVLYGLFQAKDSIRRDDNAILVEGYADVIALSQSGFKNVVAASGTSLTSDQLNLLRRYTRNIILLFDADIAGSNAAQKGIELALEAGYDVKAIILPKGEDPDSFIQKEGKDAFQTKLADAQSFLIAKTNLLVERDTFDSYESAARAIQSLTSIIYKIPDAIKRGLAAREVNRIIVNNLQRKNSNELQEFEKFLQQIANASIQQSNQPDQSRLIKQKKKITIENENILAGLAHSAEATPAELTLLKAFLEDVSGAYLATVEIDFDFSLIDNELCRTVVMYAIRTYEESGIPPVAADIIEYFRDDAGIATLVTDSMIDRDRVSAEWKVVELDKSEQVRLMARQAAASIMVEARNKQMSELQRQLQTARAEEQEHIMQKLFDYAQEVKVLREAVITSL